MAKRHEKRARADVEAIRERAQKRADVLSGKAERGYTEFAETGGVSPEEKEDIRRRTSYGISSLYDALRRNLERRKAVQGGYAPGYSESQARLGRGMAEEIGRALTGTDIGLAELVRGGRLAGLGGLGGMFGVYEGQQVPLLGLQSQLARTKGIAQTIQDWQKALGTGAQMVGGFI